MSPSLLKVAGERPVAESMFQNQVPENAQKRNPEQTNCRAEDRDPIWPTLSDNASPQHDCGGPDHSYSGTDGSQNEYVAGGVQGWRKVWASR